MSDPIATTVCRFLELPGEIRNRIYRHLLVQDTLLVVDEEDGITEPALLRASSQIRREAITIFYGENTFGIPTRNYDCATAAKWNRRENVIQARHYVGITSQGYGSLGQPSWTNLRQWLQRQHEGTVEFNINKPSKMSADGPCEWRDDVWIGHMFELVEELKDLPWERVARLLDEGHEALARCDEAWK